MNTFTTALVSSCLAFAAAGAVAQDAMKNVRCQALSEIDANIKA